MRKRDNKPVTKECTGFKDAHAFIILNALIDQAAKNPFVENFIAKNAKIETGKISLTLSEEQQN